MKHWKYLKYVVRHKWFVFLACWKLAWIHDCPSLIWRGIVHDWTKFLPSEWFPYVEFFYGKYARNEVAKIENLTLEVAVEATRVRNEFTQAWLFHQNRNRHHWQYWVVMNDSGTVEALLVPKVYMLEMVADWVGAGRAITGKIDVKEWYRKNRPNIRLHGDTAFDVTDIILLDF